MDLSDDKLYVKEAWAVNLEKEASFSTLIRDRILQNTMLVTSVNETEPFTEAIKEDKQTLENLMTNVSVDAKAMGDDQDARYREVFGDVTEADINALNEMLDNRQVTNAQESKSKDSAMRNLEQSLNKKFNQRVR